MKIWILREDISTTRKVWSIFLLIAAVGSIFLGLVFWPLFLLAIPLFLGSWTIGR